MKRQLQNNLVEIHVDSTPQATASGIQLYKKKERAHLEGIVKAVGPEVENVAVGDTVLFLPYGYSPLQDNEGDLDEVESMEVKTHIYFVHEPSIQIKLIRE